MRRLALLVIALYCVGVCVRGHTERYLISAGWTQFIWVGKVMVPIMHPPIYGSRWVCDECSEDKR